MVMIKGSMEGEILQDTQYLSANCVLLIYYKYVGVLRVSLPCY